MAGVVNQKRVRQEVFANLRARISDSKCVVRPARMEPAARESQTQRPFDGVGVPVGQARASKETGSSQVRTAIGDIDPFSGGFIHREVLPDVPEGIPTLGVRGHIDGASVYELPLDVREVTVEGILEGQVHAARESIEPILVANGCRPGQSLVEFIKAIAGGGIIAGVDRAGHGDLFVRHPEYACAGCAVGVHDRSDRGSQEGV